MSRSIFKQLCRYTKRQQNLFGMIRSSSSSPMPKPSLDLELNRIVWIDMEMTGLNIETDQIMEVACLVTDSNLNILAEGPNLIIHHHKSILNSMHEWCIKQHMNSGLTESCIKSGTSIEQAENELLEFVKKYITEKQSPLAGNSVYMDRIFLRKFMPKLDSYLHYRLIDVSTIKEICQRWNPEIYKQAPKKEFSHRALDDIKESVAELKFYKDHFFKLSL